MGSKFDPISDPPEGPILRVKWDPRRAQGQTGGQIGPPNWTLDLGSGSCLSFGGLIGLLDDDFGGSFWGRF